MRHAFRWFVLLWVFVLIVLKCHGQQVITATVAVTNAVGTTNGETLTINGTLRTFTNNVQNNVQILYSNTPVMAASNIYTAYIVNPQSKVITAWASGSTNVTFQCYPGSGLSGSISAGWGTITFVTNTLNAAIVVRIPANVEGGPMQTNIGSQLEQYLESSTNALPSTNTFASNYMSLTITQLVGGVKTFTNTASAWWGTITNSPAINGTVLTLTNGYWTNAILNNPTFTNGVNYSNAFSSPGSAGGAEQFGVGAVASGSFATAVGGGATASGNGSVSMGNSSSASAGQSSAVGNGANASKIGASAFGNNATASGTNSTALGVGSTTAGFTNSTAVGYFATVTAANQIMLGSAGVSSVVNNYLSVLGGATFAQGITNVFHNGTNYFPAGSDVSFGRFAISSLANGNNAGVIVGTNVFCDLSGPSGAFTINGINGSPNRDGKLIMLQNNTGFTLTLANDSGTDPVAGNRIYTGYNADTSYTNKPGVITLIYNANLSRWVIVASPRTSNFP